MTQPWEEMGWRCSKLRNRSHQLRTIGLVLLHLQQSHYQHCCASCVQALCSAFCQCYHMYSSQMPPKVGMNIIPTLMMGEMKLRDVK